MQDVKTQRCCSFHPTLSFREGSKAWAVNSCLPGDYPAPLSEPNAFPSSRHIPMPHQDNASSRHWPCSRSFSFLGVTMGRVSQVGKVLSVDSHRQSSAELCQPCPGKRSTRMRVGVEGLPRAWEGRRNDHGSLPVGCDYLLLPMTPQRRWGLI